MWNTVAVQNKFEFLVSCETTELWNAIAQIEKLPKLCDMPVQHGFFEYCSIDYYDSILSADNIARYFEPKTACSYMLRASPIEKIIRERRLGN